jgi:murein L,D-transpeptidase YcbB/YkuD
VALRVRTAVVIAAVFGAWTSLIAQPWTIDGEISRDVRVFYERRSDRPIWIDGQNRPTDAARAMLARLRAAAEDGLASEDYEVAVLEGQAALLAERNGPLEGADAAAFDVMLTQNALRYFRHLHIGRVTPRDLGFHLDHAREPHDFPALLQLAADTQSLGTVIENLRPPFVQYRGLKDALKVYRHRDPGRARQIELAMERLRWLPDLRGERLLVVNIPMFFLWGWESSRADGMPAISMAAIIGRASATRTPVFMAPMSSLVFNPDWNVPKSIVRDEILPKLSKDPGYLARNHMEILSSDAIPRIRQRPGPWNALGQLKFVFPNVFDIYLHGTPQPQLFRSPRRDFSHGCIRVEDPAALAEWVLRGQTGWTLDSIHQAIASGETRAVPVDGLRVVVFYMTAVFMPAEGTVQFADDIYGHDARLDAWLRARTGGDE